MLHKRFGQPDKFSVNIKLPKLMKFIRWVCTHPINFMHVYAAHKRA